MHPTQMLHKIMLNVILAREVAGFSIIANAINRARSFKMTAAQEFNSSTCLIIMSVGERAKTKTSEVLKIKN